MEIPIKNRRSWTENLDSIRREKKKKKKRTANLAHQLVMYIFFHHLFALFFNAK